MREEIEYGGPMGDFEAVLGDDRLQKVLDRMRALGVSRLRVGEIDVTIDTFAPMGAATRIRKDFEQ
jgi:hypothetical protein